jgi:hypothetical protein
MKPNYKLTARSARIVEQLAVFDFQLEYKKELTNPIDGLSRRLDYFAGFKEGVKHDALQGMLPRLQQQLQVMYFLGSEPNGKNMQSGCNSHAIRISTQDPQIDHSEKVIASVVHSHIKDIDHTRSNDSRPVRPRFVTNTKGGYLLVSRLAAIEAAASETALDKPPESLIDFVRKVQQKDASAYTDCDRELTAGYERNSQGLLRFHGRVVVLMLVAL